MTITKYLHSCLYIEHEGRTVLIDPGQFTYEAGVLDLQAIKPPDYLVFTHEHSDHFYQPFLIKLIAAFPDVRILTTPFILDQIGQAHKHVDTKSNDVISVRMIEHEDILLLPRPENIAVTIQNSLTHPGDSYQLETTAEILAMPMTAPWGSIVQSMKKILELNPKVVIPIHDWHWKHEALEGFYPRVKTFLKEAADIEFVIPETGKAISI